MIKTYRELSKLSTFMERFEYLKLDGIVGQETFGFDRYLNQVFYRSKEWKRIRDTVIARDLGCDLGIEGREIYGRVLIHHMNPITLKQINDRDLSILDPEFLITTSKRTHDAIHYSDSNILYQEPVERVPGDTKLW